MSIIHEMWEKLNLNCLFPFYFFNMDISLDIILAFTRFSTSIENSLMQGTMSQNFHLGLSFDFITKNGNFCEFLLFFFKYLFSYFSTCHKIKTKAYITDLRHHSLVMGLINRC